MIHKEDIKKIAQQILHPRPKFRSTRRIYPMREWFIGLLIALCALGGVAAGSAHLYFKYQGTSISEFQVSNDGVVVYRESLVNSALEKYAERERKLRALVGEEYRNSSEVSSQPEDGPAETTGDVATSTEEVIQETELVEEDIVLTEEETATEEELIIDILAPEEVEG